MCVQRRDALQLGPPRPVDERPCGFDGGARAGVVRADVLEYRQHLLGALHDEARHDAKLVHSQLEVAGHGLHTAMISPATGPTCHQPHGRVRPAAGTGWPVEHGRNVLEQLKLIVERTARDQIERDVGVLVVDAVPPGCPGDQFAVDGLRRRTLGWTDALRNIGTVILPKERDPRFITIRRGGTLTDDDHRLLALWAALCAEHVLPLFESARPDDPRPRQAIEQIRAWAQGEIRMSESRAAGGHAMAAARPLSGAARYAAFAAGQAGVVAHVAAHELGAAAYAIKAVRAAAPRDEGESSGRLECRWQREQLPDAIRELVLDDQRLRNEICWSVFE